MSRGRGLESRPRHHFAIQDPFLDYFGQKNWFTRENIAVLLVARDRFKYRFKISALGFVSLSFIRNIWKLTVIWDFTRFHALNCYSSFPKHFSQSFFAWADSDYTNVSIDDYGWACLDIALFQFLAWITIDFNLYLIEIRVASDKV